MGGKGKAFSNVIMSTYVFTLFCPVDLSVLLNWKSLFSGLWVSAECFTFIVFSSPEPKAPGELIV